MSEMILPTEFTAVGMQRFGIAVLPQQGKEHLVRVIDRIKFNFIAASFTSYPSL